MLRRLLIGLTCLLALTSSAQAITVLPTRVILQVGVRDHDTITATGKHVAIERNTCWGSHHDILKVTSTELKYSRDGQMTRTYRVRIHELGSCSIKFGAEDGSAIVFVAAMGKTAH